MNDRQSPERCYNPRGYQISPGNFLKSSDFHWESKGLDVNVRIIGNDAIFNGIEERTFRQIERAQHLHGINKIVVNTDIYYGYEVPVGTVTVSERDYYGFPEIGKGACGMCLLVTPLAKDDILNIKTGIQGLADIIGKEVSEKKTFIQDPLLLESILYRGIEHFHCSPDDKSAMEDIGFQMKNLPSYFFNEVKSLNEGHGPEFGMIGSGNHFVDIMFVNKVDSSVASKWGLSAGQVVIMIHSDSLDVETVMKKQFTNNPGIIEKFVKYQSEGGFISIPEGTDEFSEYMNAFAANRNYAIGNRYIMTEILRNIFKKQFGIMQDKIYYLYDQTHHGVHFENYNGKKILMHRFDANMLYPAGHDALKGKKWSTTGNPGFIAGQGIGNPNYIVAAGDNSALTYHTVCHGLGKKENITPEAAIQKYGLDLLREGIGNVISNSKGIEPIAPRSSKLLFKSPYDVLNSLESGDIARKVVELYPICNVKG